MRLLLLLAAGLALTIGPPAAAQPPDRVAILDRPLRVAPATPVFEAPLHVAARPNAREVFGVRVAEAGRLEVEARWPGNQPLALLLNVPGQPNALARADGTSPLRLHLDVTEAMLATEDFWRISVVNFSGQGPEAVGTLTVHRAASRHPDLSRLLRPNRPLIPVRPEAPADTAGQGASLEILEDGTLRFTYSDGSMREITPEGDVRLLMIHPVTGDTLRTMQMMIEVQWADLPAPPSELAATPDMQTWWNGVLAWVDALARQTQGIIGQVYPPEEMSKLNAAAADVAASPPEHLEYRLNFLDELMRAIALTLTE